MIFSPCKLLNSLKKCEFFRFSLTFLWDYAIMLQNDWNILATQKSSKERRPKNAKAK